MEVFRRAVLFSGVRQITNDGAVRIEELFVYPVKSCGGISISSSLLSPTGLEYDRTFAVVNEDKLVQTQRQKRVLATIRPEINEIADTLTLRAGSAPPLIAPLNGRTGWEPDVAYTRSGIEMPVFRFRASRQWLTPLLRAAEGLSIRDGSSFATGGDFFELVRYDPNAQQKRRVADFIGGDNARPEDIVAFPDLFPLLLCTVESLTEVNRRAGTNFNMNRFRPNVVVSGAKLPFDEDRWAVVKFSGGITLRCLENDPRCQIPSIDQATGIPDPRFEPTTTLRKFRRLPNIFGQHGDLASAGPLFGIYAVHGTQRGRLSVGDSMTVLERSDKGSLHEYWTSRGTSSWDSESLGIKRPQNEV